jgi:hypothetical protein
MSRNVGHATAPEAANVMMGIRAPVVPSGAVGVGELDRELAPDQGLEALVDGGEGDARKLVTHVQEDLVGSRMAIRRREEAVHCGALLREALPAGLQSPPEDCFHRALRGGHPALGSLAWETGFHTLLLI